MDGNKDLVIQYGQQFTVFMGHGDGTFTPQTALGATAINLPSATAFPIWQFQIADMDNDGNPDLVVLYRNTASSSTPLTSPAQLSIYYGLGNGTFVPTPVNVPLARNYIEMAITDVNNDGYPDVIPV